MLKSVLKKVIRSFGYELTKTENRLSRDGVPMDITDPQFLRLFRKCNPYSFTGIAPLFSLYACMKYIIENKIEGDFVECGVWKGGSAMMMALVLKEAGITDRKLFLYDTFEGMSEPGAEDEDFRGNPAKKLLDRQERTGGKNVWCYSTLDEVKENMRSTGYPEENIIYVKGKVEETIPGTMPTGISLLRLDTDWFESTFHELQHLYPLLATKGVLIIDDYGHWKGARKAVDRYFTENKISLLLHRIDYTVRVAIKH